MYYKEQASRKNYHKFPFVTSLLDLNGYRHGDEKGTRTIYIHFLDYMWDMRNLDLLYGIELKSF